jgi:hypothetical protein
MMYRGRNDKKKNVQRLWEGVGSGEESFCQSSGINPTSLLVVLMEHGSGNEESRVY